LYRDLLADATFHKARLLRGRRLPVAGDAASLRLLGPPGAKERLVRLHSTSTEPPIAGTRLFPELVWRNVR
jgi:hypothetical protein